MSDQVKVPVWFAQLAIGLLLSGSVALQCYVLKKVSALEVNVAALTARIDDHIGAKQLTQK